ncbi:DUF1223 domain-containing protein [Mucilaginibacter mali]|uniref:DUF1223 domain-containing protein n=1 Tax=Mucilaginibacter mali TaxID=2740462 RepID=A0A7D4UNN8_9SPHI|nr:DUF1223 domain-containing protein [Mucilaginibacter mali]QKJ29160.1 DUF1223 domain-containing protein [Mucilaginibacter mali]
MRNLYGILAALLLVTGIGVASTGKYGARIKQGNGEGFALVELYTSEGCSSCPPADKLLAKITKEYKDKEVYVLAYHVDYWNRLGWKDVFSNPLYSERQRTYSSYLKLDGVYTPQAIVNGQTEFVGSDEAKMNTAIKQALAKAAPARLELSNLKINGSKAILQYHVSGTPGGSNLMLAVIKKYAQTQVKAGENNGRMLSHINIVQRLESIVLKNNAGSAEIALPNNFNNKDWDIIGFVQVKSTGEIRIAASTESALKEKS